MDKSLLEQIGRAMGGTGTRGLCLTYSSYHLSYPLPIEGPLPPYSPNDPPAQPFTGSSVNFLNEIEMTTFRSDITGGMP